MVTVLIVDDSRTSRRFLRNMLTEAGYEVVAEAVDGEDGMKKYCLLYTSDAADD